jgi:CheY-like chemotaxis protein
MCEAFACTYACATNGPDAVQAVRAGRFDLVLMDTMMPGMDGNETTRAIRSLGGAAGRTPIIAVTASASDASLKKCYAAGANGAVEKPISPASLRSAMLAVLAPRSAGQPAMRAHG